MSSIRNDPFESPYEVQSTAVDMFVKKRRSTRPSSKLKNRSKIDKGPSLYFDRYRSISYNVLYPKRSFRAFLRGAKVLLVTVLSRSCTIRLRKNYLKFHNNAVCFIKSVCVEFGRIFFHRLKRPTSTKTSKNSLPGPGRAVYSALIGDWLRRPVSVVFFRKYSEQNEAIIIQKIVTTKSVTTKIIKKGFLTATQTLLKKKLRTITKEICIQ